MITANNGENGACLLETTLDNTALWDLLYIYTKLANTYVGYENREENEGKQILQCNTTIYVYSYSSNNS